MLSFAQGMEESKRLRYLNLFVLLGREEDLNIVVKAVENIVKEHECKYDIKKSFLGNFYYIRIYCYFMQLEELQNKVELELRKFEDVISWMKTEVIEVK